MTWELRHGDCLDPVTGLASLADRSVDHVITDPPYSERVHRNLGAEDRSDRTEARAVLRFAHITHGVARAVSEAACRIARGWILFFCDERAFEMWAQALEDAGGCYVRGGVWVKKNPMPQMSGDRPSAGSESIVIGHAPYTGRMSWNGGGSPAVYVGPVAHGARAHPAEKPLWLMESLVRHFSAPGELILDPFAGVATTGVAAIRNGRRFIGWERDPQYHTLAMRRITAAREQLDLFTDGGGSAA